MNCKDNIEVNGFPVDFVLRFVTEPDESGWKGSQYVGTYESTDALNDAINMCKNNCPVGWELEISFVDKPFRGE